MPQAGPDAIIRLAELTIDPAHLAAYLAALDEEIAASLRLEPGVLMLSAVQLRDQPCEIRILEIYADRAAYEAHIRSPHFLTYKTATLSMVQRLALTDVDPIRIGVAAQSFNRN